MKNLLAIIVAIGISVLVVACEQKPPLSDQIQQKRMETLVAEAVARVGSPAITNFTELRDMKENYELRDKSITTYTYMKNDIPHVVPGVTVLGGTLTFLCTSIGYGLPYGVQLSNPSKAVWYQNGGWLVLPQAEPNGLFMPSTAEGTWVKCKDPNGGPDVKPILVEPRGVYSPFKFPFDK